MNIGIVIEDISLKAGTEKAVSNLANILIDLKHQVTIYSMFSNQSAKPYYKLATKVAVINLNFTRRGKLRYYSYAKLLGFLHKEHNIDVLIGSTHAINCILAFCKTNAKKIGCEHFNYNQCPKMWRKIRANAYPKLDAVVVLTYHDAKHYQFIPSNKLYVIPNSIPDVQFNKYHTESKTIISAGRLNYQKGFDILLRVAANVHKSLPDLRFEIYGEGEDKEKLKQVCRKLNAEDYVLFMGRTDHLIDVMRHSSMYLMTSRFEGLPMVLIEAQSCGLPIISFDCPEGPSEIVNDGEDGFLIEPGNEEVMIKKIIELATDNVMRNEFSKKATINSHKYTEKNIAKKWDNLLNTVCGDEK